MSRYLFINDEQKPAEEWSREGKVEWPNTLDIDLSRRDALRLIEELSRLLQVDPSERLRFHLAGALRPDDDDPAGDDKKPRCWFLNGHVKVWARHFKLSHPLQKDWICADCLEEGRDLCLSGPGEPTYDELVAKKAAAKR